MKFYVIENFTRPRVIEDDDVLADVFRTLHSADYIGIDHVDRSGKSSRGVGGGGGIKILN
ncbi:hypothetical protein HK100_008120 [Physocladia obscura]|uniref:Uncharacterized protein n=1 Tax=Physocladia obscura TaxID=109957 RepID=A0AAD5XI89_9FUNG|nr:hypothetical protein HK100_008120 [Physocladia obscura]